MKKAIYLCVLLLLTACQAKDQQSSQEEASLSSAEVTSHSEEAAAEPEPLTLSEPLAGLPAKTTYEPWEGEANRFVIRSVGDVLIHDRVSHLADTSHELYQAAKAQMPAEVYGFEPVAADFLAEGYDFDPMVWHIAPFVAYADLSIANLEVIAASPQLPMAGYPQFNAPRAILTTLKKLGIDHVTNGSNHTLDWYGEGARTSIENISEVGLTYSGSYASWEDYAQPRIYEANGLKVGLLTYSYGTNGMPIPPGEEYLISLTDLDIMLEEIAQVQNQCDAMVVTLQLGPEYDPWPDATQEHVFQALADAGVDVILGGHPHVLQPLVWLNEGGSFGIYSQASFVSGQEDLSNKQGGITEIVLEKAADGQVSVTDVSFMPIFMLGVRDEKMYETVPLADYDYYQIPDGASWWSELAERMQAFTTEVNYVTHLETAWTEATDSTFR
ncbi:CapA family protein [Suicoccus acidiformans]|nr:CapA family protein [Suicoccus acidiformans]